MRFSQVIIAFIVQWYASQLPAAAVVSCWCDSVSVQFFHEENPYMWDSIYRQIVSELGFSMSNPRERITAAQALEHDYFWTDPLPADPKS